MTAFQQRNFLRLLREVLAAAIILMAAEWCLAFGATPLLSPRQAASQTVPMKKPAKPAPPLDARAVLNPAAFATIVARPDPNRLVTNRLTLTWSNAPGIRGLKIWHGTNEFSGTAMDEWKEITIDPVQRFAFTTFIGKAKDRPTRIHGAIASIGYLTGETNLVLSELVRWHYPPYPPIFTETGTLSWQGQREVAVFETTDFKTWMAVTNVVAASSVVVDMHDPRKSFRAITPDEPPVTLTLTMIFKPDPREVKP